MPSKKVVRFYEATTIDQKDNVKTMDSRFWSTLLKNLGTEPHTARIFTYSGTEYYGEAKRGKTPAVAYLYAGRLRGRDDWPDTFDSTSGVVSELQLAGQLVEPTYIVPFGNNNYCAVMTPRIGGLHPSALESWLTAALGLTTTGDRIELRPLINTDVATKLDNVAVGVTKLSVRFPAGTDFPPQADRGGGDVGEAMRVAAAGTTADMSAEVVYSLGHSRGTAAARTSLLTAARWIVRRNYADKATVSMLIPQTDADGETLRTESHDLIKDRVTYQVSMATAEGQPPLEKSVLSAIQDAIDRYRREH